MTSLTVPASEAHPHSMMLPPPAWFPPDVTLGIQAKEFNHGFIRPENLVSHGQRVLQVPYAKLKAGCDMLFTKEWLPSGHKVLIGGVLQIWLFFWKVFPSPQRNSRALSE